MKKQALTAASIAAAFALGTAGTAAAAGLVGHAGIRDGAVHGDTIRDGAVHKRDLSAGVAKALALGASTEGRTFGPATVAKVGGPFKDNATHAGTFALQPGTYLLAADGFFHTTEATSGQTRMQVAVRGEDGTVWGSDLGTCFTGAISPTADRESTCSTVRTVTVGEPTTVDVMVFGYADDQGSADSGKVDAAVSVSAVRVG